MLEVRKSRKAERDLIDAWLYGNAKWGEEQADSYIDAIEQAIERLRLQPGIGVDCGDLRPGYRRWRSGVHHIYYVVEEACIRVIRVLSARQDPSLHLDE